MRAERLRRTKDIELVRAGGEQRTDRHFSLRARRNGLPIVRLAVASPRSIGTAVKRARARRRLREAIRADLRARPTVAGTDVFVVARAPALAAPVDAVRAAVRRHLDSVLSADA
jgi:ribonuclease P protein component